MYKIEVEKVESNIQNGEKVNPRNVRTNLLFRKELLLILGATFILRVDFDVPVPKQVDRSVRIRLIRQKIRVKAPETIKIRDEIMSKIEKYYQLLFEKYEILRKTIPHQIRKIKVEILDEKEFQFYYESAGDLAKFKTILLGPGGDEIYIGTTGEYRDYDLACAVAFGVFEMSQGGFGPPRLYVVKTPLLLARLFANEIDPIKPEGMGRKDEAMFAFVVSNVGMKKFIECFLLHDLQPIKEMIDSLFGEGAFELIRRHRDFTKTPPERPFDKFKELLKAHPQREEIIERTKEFAGKMGFYLPEDIFE